MSAPYTVLVVDDDPSILHLVSTIIRAMDGYAVATARDGQAALAAAKARPPDLIVADVGLPDMDGYALCQAVRATAELAGTFILLLTARDAPIDKYEGFAAGADDYLVKPFDNTELQYRIRALLRRAERGTPPPSGVAWDEWQAFGPIALHPGRTLLRLDGREVGLTPSEFAVIRYLTRNPGLVVDVQTLLVQALDYPPDVGTSSIVHSHVRNIRAKCRQLGIDAGFLTSNRKGYWLEVSQEA